MKSMTIGKKLFLSFGAALALTLVVSVVSLVDISSLATALNKVIKVDATKRFLASDINTIASDLIAAERGIIARAYMKDNATVEKYNGEFHDAQARLQRRLDEFRPLIETAEARQMIQEIESDQQALRSNHEEIFRLAGASRAEEAAAAYKDKILPLMLKAKATCGRLVEEQTGLLAAVGKSGEASVSQSRWTTILMIALSLVVTGMVVFIVQQINRDLRQTVTELRAGAEQTASAASQVLASSQSLAQGASEQAASLEETSASSEEINSMAQKNTENSRGAADLVTQSQQKFVETNQSLQHMVVAMGEIKTSSDKISKIFLYATSV
jgi:methyl-accepting chemotaxis protein/methyl-accepting chemotaxis protein-1 (serine sensor receptor)